MRQLGDDSPPDGPHAFIYRLFLVCIGVGLPVLASFIGWVAVQVWNMGGRVDKHDAEISAISDIALRIDHHLEAIDTRYVDLTSATKSAQGAIETKESEISALRTEAAESRSNIQVSVHDLSERVDRENAALASRIQQLENIIAPLRDGHRS